jgi:hypothetical protein
MISPEDFGSKPSVSSGLKSSLLQELRRQRLPVEIIFSFKVSFVAQSY